VKALLAAIAFLTRVPVPARWCFDAPDVGRATVFFPLVGAAIGGVAVVALKLLSVRVAWGQGPRFGGPWLPPALTAVCLVSLTAWVTGGLHLDGLADMADGFGGGRSREEVLRIMRDPSIGAFGATALVLLLSGKVLSLGSLIERGAAVRYLLVAPPWAAGPPSPLAASCRAPGGRAAWERPSPTMWGVVSSSAPRSWRRRYPFSSAPWPPPLAGQRRSR
jgi:cobalamin 5'-phosphate synthase/cobalamin synthase